MSSETQTGVSFGTGTTTAVGGALAGIIASAVMGVLMLLQMQPVVEAAIPALYGQGSSLGVGFAFHLVHGAVFGLLFVDILRRTPLDDHVESLPAMAGIGLAYGVAVWLVAAVVLMPIWLSAAGFPNAPSAPNVSTTSLVGHTVFGLTLGIVYPFVRQ